MTCIAAIVENGIGYMAGERAASNGSTIMPISTPKVWKVNGYLMGYYGSFSLEKLKYNFNPHPLDNNDVETFMNSQFIEDLHNAYDTLNINRSEDTELLIVAGGKIFVHNAEDMSMVMYDTNFMAQGSGGEYAMGALYASELPARERLDMAMYAATKFSPGCIGPIDIISTEDN